MPRRWILVVEDDPTIIKLAEEFFRGPEAEVTYCNDAMQCFIQARDLKPAIVICDLMMPGFGTGDAAYRELRKDARTKEIPFIFVSGMSEERIKSMVPSDDPKLRVMRKPLDWPLLKSWVAEMSGLKLNSDMP